VASDASWRLVETEGGGRELVVAAAALMDDGSSLAGRVPSDSPEREDNYTGEIAGMIAALSALPAGSRVLLIVDATSPIEAWFRFRRCSARKRRGFMAWEWLERLDAAAGRHAMIVVRWQTSHVGDAPNEVVDRMAEEAAHRTTEIEVDAHAAAAASMKWGGCVKSTLQWAKTGACAHVETWLRTFSEHSTFEERGDIKPRGLSNNAAVWGERMRTGRACYADPRPSWKSGEAERRAARGCPWCGAGGSLTWWHVCIECRSRDTAVEAREALQTATLALDKIVQHAAGGHRGPALLLKALGGGHIAPEERVTIRGLLGGVCGTSGDVERDKKMATRKAAAHIVEAAARLLQMADDDRAVARWRDDDRKRARVNSVMRSYMRKLAACAWGRSPEQEAAREDRRRHVGAFIRDVEEAAAGADGDTCALLAQERDGVLSRCRAEWVWRGGGQSRGELRLWWWIAARTFRWRYRAARGMGRSAARLAGEGAEEVFASIRDEQESVVSAGRRTGLSVRVTRRVHDLDSLLEVVVRFERRLRRYKRVKLSAPGPPPAPARTLHEWLKRGVDCTTRAPTLTESSASAAAAKRAKRRKEDSLVKRGLAAGPNRAWAFEDILAVRRRATRRAQFEALVRWVGRDDDGAQLYEDSWQDVNATNFPSPGTWGAAAIKARARAAEGAGSSSGHAAERPQMEPTRVQPRRARRQVQRLGFGRCYRVVDERGDDGGGGEDDDYEDDEYGPPSDDGDAGSPEPPATAPPPRAHERKRQAERSPPSRKAPALRTPPPPIHIDLSGTAEGGDDVTMEGMGATSAAHGDAVAWIDELRDVLADDDGCVEDLVKCAALAGAALEGGFLPRVMRTVAGVLVHGGESAYEVISTIERWVGECVGEEETAAELWLEEWGTWCDRILDGGCEAHTGQGTRDLAGQWEVIRRHVGGILRGHLRDVDMGEDGGSAGVIAEDDCDMGEGAC
jgi:ribonuclease HI